jgi:predicted NAD/FAD-binding protein
MRIAIVGAGVSGLVAAHLLHREHEITVFESEDWIGGHTHTVEVQTSRGTLPVDTGFIVMNDRNYPVFTKLLEKLGVATKLSDMSFSVSDGGALEYSSTSLGGLFANPRHLASPGFARMLLDVRRFQREARTLLATPADDHGPSLAAYLERHRYSRPFIDHLLVPQAAAVWSADPRQMDSLPAKFLVEFFSNHGMLELRNRPKWSVVEGGSRAYVKALISPFADRVRTRTRVTGIARRRDHIEVSAGTAQPFDRVVLATHSDQALSLIEDPTGAEREILGAIPYQPNEVVLHSDRSLLPKRRRAWASWNYHLHPEPAGRARVTYHMNRLQSLDADRELCVTLNHTAAVDPDRILGRWTYEHPVYTRKGVAAQRRRAEIDGVDRIHYCGAYWGWGFHEDGVVSAVETCASLGGRL